MNINLSRLSNEELENLIEKAKRELVNRDSQIRISFKPRYEDLLLEVNREEFQDDTKYNLISWSGKSSRFGISLSEIIKRPGTDTLYTVNPKYNELLKEALKYNKKVKDLNFIIQGNPCMEKDGVKYTSSLSGEFIFDMRTPLPRGMKENSEDAIYYKRLFYIRENERMNRFLENKLTCHDDQGTRTLLLLLKFEKI